MERKIVLGSVYFTTSDKMSSCLLFDSCNCSKSQFIPCVMLKHIANVALLVTKVWAVISNSLLRLKRNFLFEIRHIILFK
jgi:hypothetical protein